MLKAQVLAGGRALGTFSNGFRGGVQIVTAPGQVRPGQCPRVRRRPPRLRIRMQARHFAGKMLGQRLVTKQTGPEGRLVSKVFLMERLYMRKEMYLV